MSYYDSIDDDVKRAKEILEKGRLKDDDFYPDVEAELKARLVADSGHIFGGDTYAAYKLLESFVAEITALGRTIEVYQQQLAKRDAEIRELREALLALQEHLAATKRCDFPEHAEATRLRALVDAVGEDVCKTALRLQKRLHDQS